MVNSESLRYRFNCYNFMTSETDKTELKPIGKSFSRIVVCDGCQEEVLRQNAKHINGQLICSCCAEYNVF